MKENGKRRVKSKTKQKECFLSHPDTKKLSSYSDSIFTNEDIMTQILAFVPGRDRLVSQSLVCKKWKQIVEVNIPLGLRIEDQSKELWFFRPEWKLRVDGLSDRDEILYPFRKIGSLPTHIRQRVTQLTLVMRMTAEYTNEYHLGDMRDILKDFTNLQDLRVMSQLGPGDFFCALFQQRGYFPRLRTLYISGYCLDKRSKDWEVDGPRVNGSDLEDLIEAAPNLEHLEMSSVASGFDLTDLLPLCGSLRAIRIHTFSCGNQKCIGGDVDAFVNKMPHLRSWDFEVGDRFIFGSHPPKQNLSDLSKKFDFCYGISHDKKTIRYLDIEYFRIMQDERCLSITRFFDRFLAWYFSLKKEEKDDPEVLHLMNIPKTCRLHCDGYLCAPNIGTRAARSVILRTSVYTKKVFRKIVAQTRMARWGRIVWRIKLPRYTKILFRLQKHSQFISFEEGQLYYYKHARVEKETFRVAHNAIFSEVAFSLSTVLYDYVENWSINLQAMINR